LARSNEAGLGGGRVNGRDEMTRTEHSDRDYWKANLRLVRTCMIIWALASFGMGILFRPFFTWLEFGGTDIGFWFAQQGSILVFIGLIFYYAVRMNAIDREHGVEES
jgi:putative solute:sodium symporter small subunit